MMISFDLRLGFRDAKGDAFHAKQTFDFDFAVPRSGSGKLTLPWTNVGRPGAQKGSGRAGKKTRTTALQAGAAN
ncbi:MULTISPECIES: hypothetical protein [unclassified Mesorhizobium]|uniref:hypothetical protein n=1 Tax=unclassified Mesorhizobium TaxID=325217 RepID=UPI0011291A3C|nr:MULTISPECIES: hypothetical protein [unclassified Mesorhizobium]MBZ9697506.1 hypothetical protein [Mesorhizobium sp. CO1-1-9]TPK13079.1 hypothetical protein FJ543_14765 [Mesorhizobium sp. B2-5-7]